MNLRRKKICLPYSHWIGHKRLNFFMTFLIAKIIVQLHFRMNKTGTGHESTFSLETLTYCYYNFYPETKFEAQRIKWFVQEQISFKKRKQDLDTSFFFFFPCYIILPVKEAPQNLLTLKIVSPVSDIIGYITLRYQTTLNFTTSQ